MGAWWLRQWRVHLQSGRAVFIPWVGKISWRREWQTTPVSLLREIPRTEGPFRRDREELGTPNNEHFEGDDLHRYDKHVRNQGIDKTPGPKFPEPSPRASWAIN